VRRGESGSKEKAEENPKKKKTTENTSELRRAAIFRGQGAAAPTILSPSNRPFQKRDSTKKGKRVKGTETHGEKRKGKNLLILKKKTKNAPPEDKPPNEVRKSEGGRNRGEIRMGGSLFWGGEERVLCKRKSLACQKGQSPELSRNI